MPKSEAKTTVVLELTVEEAELLRRLVNVISAGGKTATKEAAVALALEETLERRDPRRRAERYAERQAKAASSIEGKVSHTETTSSPPPPQESAGAKQSPAAVPGQSNSPETVPGQRAPVPEALRHQVYLRDGGVCQQRMPDGRCCVRKSPARRGAKRHAGLLI